jgi:hypothetical protein
MTNPAIARIRTALPLVYTLGLWGEVLAFLFFSDPGGPRLRSAAARKSFPKKERAKKKSRQPGESRQPGRARSITTTTPSASSVNAFQAMDQAFETVSKVAGDNA